MHFCFPLDPGSSSSNLMVSYKGWEPRLPQLPPGYATVINQLTGNTFPLTLTVNSRYPGDLRTRKRTGTSCQIEIHFSIKTTDYLLKYTLLRFQIYVRAIVLITKQD